MNFDDSGRFKFALVNPAGTSTFWSNNGTSVAGSEPTAFVALAVTNGLYSVLLGDATLPNMTAIPSSVFKNADVRLRVWFNDGVNGTQLLTPDQRIAAVGYAIMAADVPDGAITTAKLANTSGSGNVVLSNGANMTNPTINVGTGGTIATAGTGSIAATSAPASGLTGTTLASGVTGSSLTSVGTLTNLAVAVDDGATNTVSNVATLRHTTTGTAANNIGVGVTFESENSIGNPISAAQIAGVLTNTSVGSEVGRLNFLTRTGIDFSPAMTLDNTGVTVAGALRFGGGDAISDSGNVVFFRKDNSGVQGLKVDLAPSDPTLSNAFPGGGIAVAGGLAVSGFVKTPGMLGNTSLTLSTLANSDLTLSPDGTGKVVASKVVAANAGLTTGSSGSTLAAALSATAMLDFPNTSQNSSSDRTIAVAGASLGDAVFVGAPHGSIITGPNYSGWVSAAGVVSVRFLNASTGVHDPMSGTFRVVVMR